MKTKLVEATNGQNYGKFLLGIFDAEDMSRKQEISGEIPMTLLRAIGFWEPEKALLVHDLQTGEGAIFYPAQGKDPKWELEKHQIWVCPMYEFFLSEYVYPNAEKVLRLDVPPVIELKTEYFAMAGYRRSGPAAGDDKDRIDPHLADYIRQLHKVLGSEKIRRMLDRLDARRG